MQAFSNDLPTTVYLMAHIEALVRGNQQRSAKSDCSYRREAIIPSLLSKAQQFYGLYTPLSNRHTFFYFHKQALHQYHQEETKLERTVLSQRTGHKGQSSVAFP